MKNILKLIYNRVFNDQNEIYASLAKRFCSFAIDFIIVLIIFNITMVILQYSGYDFTVITQEAVIENQGTENETITLQEVQNNKNFKKTYMLALFISALYYTLTISSKKQGTIGNIICKVMVVDIKNGRVNLLDAFIRFVAVIINNTLYGLGYLLYFYRQDRMFLQDLLSGTRVINLIENNTSTKKE